MIDRGWSPPESFDDYRIERVLGWGGMGVVYLGYDRLLQREIAIKFLQVNNSTIYRQRFTMEAQAVARIHHPNVVTIYRAGMLDKRPFLVMEYVRGSKLADFKLPIPWQQVLDIAVQLSGGLAAAHRRGVLHRDIKPSNIIVSQEGAAKLLDFGLAKLQEFSSKTGEDNGGDPDVTLDAQAIKIDKGQTGAEDAEETLEPSQLGAVIGTPRYMALEVRRGEPATRRSDIYSLGVVLFELCTGKIHSLDSDGAPYRAVDEAPEKRLVRELTSRQDPPPHALAVLIARCLAPVPARRFASADELSESFKRIGQASEPGSFASLENPYRGLQSFDEAHKAMFFGREEEARALAETLKTEPLLIVAGDSGVGKSSLCKAGLIPLIREDGLGTGASWQVLTLVPGRRPIQALASVLAPLFEVPEAALAAWLVQDPRNSMRGAPPAPWEARAGCSCSSISSKRSLPWPKRAPSVNGWQRSCSISPKMPAQPSASLPRFAAIF